ncbi:MAG: hypothetical protein WKH64_16740 [Chloroflexia bacterium]
MTSGSTWGGESTVSSVSGQPVRAVAVGGKTGGDDRLFVWAAGPNSLGGSGVVRSLSTLSSGGVFGAVTLAATSGFGQVEGLALQHAVRWNVAITGQTSLYEKPWGVFAATMGDGSAEGGAFNSWSVLGVVQRADPTAGYGFYTPSIARVGGTHRCVYWAHRPGGPDRAELGHRPAGGWDAGVGCRLLPWVCLSPRSCSRSPWATGCSWKSAARGTSARAPTVASRLLAYRYKLLGWTFTLSDADA